MPFIFKSLESHLMEKREKEIDSKRDREGENLIISCALGKMFDNRECCKTFYWQIHLNI